MVYVEDMSHIDCAFHDLTCFHIALAFASAIRRAHDQLPNHIAQPSPRAHITHPSQPSPFPSPSSYYKAQPDVLSPPRLHLPHDGPRPSMHCSIARHRSPDMKAVRRLGRCCTRFRLLHQCALACSGQRQKWLVQRRVQKVGLLGGRGRRSVLLGQCRRRSEEVAWVRWKVRAEGRGRCRGAPWMCSWQIGLIVLEEVDRCRYRSWHSMLCRRVAALCRQSFCHIAAHI